MSNPNPFPHQVVGTDFIISRPAAALFDEQGLGKTKQLIDAVAAEIRTGSLAGALIVCPNNLKATWADEIRRHSDLKPAICGGTRGARRIAFGGLKASFYVINYEAVAREMPSLRALLQFKRMAVVLDESHRIKRPNAAVSRALHQLGGLAGKRVIMTGTPVANRPEDLWSQFFFLDDGASFGTSFENFQRTFCRPPRGYVQLDQVRAKIGEMALRRLKHEALELPPKIVRTVKVPLTGGQALRYDQMREELYLWVRDLTGEQILAGGEEILVRLLRLAQLASNPRLLDASYVEEPAKLLALDGLLDEILARHPDQKVILWTSFVGNIIALAERYQDRGCVTFCGDTPPVKRDKAVSEFLSNPATRLFIGNPAACREGLTLTSANVAIYLDRTFNLVDYLQSQDRIHRISQVRPCEIYLLIADRTIDEYIDFALGQKHRVAGYLQNDRTDLSAVDAMFEKPAILRALLGPSE